MRQTAFQWIDLLGQNKARTVVHLRMHLPSLMVFPVAVLPSPPLPSLVSHFFSFFCAAFFFTSCKRFMALNCDSWDVGAFSPAAALEPLPLFPLPPPLPPPFPPALAWLLLGEPPPDEAVPLPWFSALEERLSGCLPSVRGGGGFSGAWLEPFPLPGIFAPPSPDLAPASPERPTGFWPDGGASVLWPLPLGPDEPSLEPEERGALVLAPNAAQPVSPLLEAEPLPVGLADVVDT